MPKVGLPCIPQSVLNRQQGVTLGRDDQVQGMLRRKVSRKVSR
jgi:hypothetical protein